MPTQNQKAQILKKLKEFKRRYLRKQYSDLNEAATRLIINGLLTEVLGYTELDDIKTEYRIKSEYADYVIQLARKKHFIVEVKAIQLDLNERHLKQSISYAANEGVDWIVLTNGRQIELYKVIFGKPITSKKIFSFNLNDQKELKDAAEYIYYLSKNSIKKNELDHFWKRFKALEPQELCKNLYSIDVVRFLKRVLKKKSGLSFKECDILDSVHEIIITKITSQKPRHPITVFKKKAEKPKKACDVNDRPVQS